MKGRLERKYYVPDSLVPEVRRFMEPYVELDPYAKGNGHDGYTVRSIYYDTPGMLFYHEKIDGIKIRKKLRIRGYNQGSNNPLVFLEIKRKDDRSISKNRASIYYSNVKDFLHNGDTQWLQKSEEVIGAEEARDARMFYYEYLKHNAGPVANIIYDREPYYSKFNINLRITLDKKVRSSNRVDLSQLFDDRNVKPVFPGYTVLEVKSYSVTYPSWLEYLISTLDVRHRAISKYVNGVDALNGRYHNPLTRPPLQIEHTKQSKDKTEMEVSL